jgi:hypothetical protein
MKILTLCLFAMFMTGTLSAQFVAKMEVKEPIPGICSEKDVYALFPGFTGQVAPKPPISEPEMEMELNKSLDFLKTNPKFKGKLMVNMIINCKGEMVRCEIDNKSGNDELDKQVLAYFQKFTKWTPGSLNGEKVDCSELISMEIKKGKVKF